MTTGTPKRDLAASNSLADLAARIRAEHDLVVSYLKRSLERAITAGNLLREAKKQVAHGEWLPWLHDNCQIPERTAQLYMRLSKHAPELRTKSDNLADLTVTDAVHLLEKPKLIVDDVALGMAPYMPHDGQVRLGFLYKGESSAISELFGVREDKQHSGFYQLAHIELYERAEDGGCLTQMRRPVSGDAVRIVLEHIARRHTPFDQIEWIDSDRWPFPPLDPPKWMHEQHEEPSS